MPEANTSTWLQNKLGSVLELWVPSSISGIIKTTKIDNILRCFHVLSTAVKVKLLLGILHLPRRNLDEMKHTIDGMIEKALEDNDLWVQLVANMVKTYPLTVNLNLDLNCNDIAQNVVNQLKEKVPTLHHYSTLPLECKVVNKSSLKNMVGTIPQPVNHFVLMKKPKSHTLRAELLRKSEEAQLQIKKNKGLKKFASVKQRDATQRRKEMTTMKPSMNRFFMKSDHYEKRNVILTPQIATKRHRTQERGTKLLDISEQPVAVHDVPQREAKRRKKLKQEQIQMKMQQDKPQISGEVNISEEKSLETGGGDADESKIVKFDLRDSPDESDEDYYERNSKKSDSFENFVNCYKNQNQRCNLEKQHSKNISETTSVRSQEHMLATSTTKEITINELEYVGNNNNLPQRMVVPIETNKISNGQQYFQATISANHHHIRSNLQTLINEPTVSAAVNEVEEPQQRLSLSKEQMDSARKIFQHSNKLSRPEKAVVLGFIAGSRKNPYPEQGNVVTILVNEERINCNNEDDKNNSSIRQTLLELHYETGSMLTKRRHIPSE